MKKMINSLCLLAMCGSMLCACGSVSGGGSVGGSGAGANGAASADSSSLPDYVEPVDAEQFLNRIGTVQARQDAKTSDRVLTGVAVCSMLAERGFGDCDVMTCFAMDGSYQGPALLSASDAAQYPYYEATYYTEDIMAWNLTVVGNALFVTPVNYNLREDITVQRMYSETAYLLSYDNVTNQFFEVVPNADEIDLQVLESITAAELDRLAREVLNG